MKLVIISLFLSLFFSCGKDVSVACNILGDSGEKIGCMQFVELDSDLESQANEACSDADGVPAGATCSATARTPGKCILNYIGGQSEFGSVNMYFYEPVTAEEAQFTCELSTTASNEFTTSWSAASTVASANLILESHTQTKSSLSFDSKIIYTVEDIIRNYTRK